MLKILEVKIQMDLKNSDCSIDVLNIVMNELLLSYVDIDYREMISTQIIKPYTQSIIFSREEKVYILLNKPIGYVTTAKDQFNRDGVLDLVHVKERIVPCRKT